MNFNKYGYLGILAGLILANPVVNVQASTLEQIQHASYQLYRDGVPVCSGQFVTPTKYLTASHCVKNSTPETKWHIFIYNGVDVKTFELSVDKVNVNYDTATLNLVDPQANFPFVDISKEEPKVGDTVLLASYPEVLGWLYLNKGEFNGKVTTPIGLVGVVSYQVAIDTAPGSSGGGLYYEVTPGDWKLIGTVEGGPPAHDYMSFFSVLYGVNAVVPQPTKTTRGTYTTEYNLYYNN